MEFELITPKIIRIFVKLIQYIVIFYILLNLFLFISHYYNLQSIAKLVQDSVERHGYLPKNDYNAIQSIIEMYQYNSNEDQYTPNEMSIPGIEKVITNLKIVVYGININDGTNTLHGWSETNRNSPKYNEEERYYFGDYARDNKRKQQQGAVLYCGITCKYHIIHPLSWYEPADVAIFMGPGNANIFRPKDGMLPWLTDSRDVSTLRNEIYNNMEEIDTSMATNVLNNTTGRSYTPLERSLFISPVITQEFYPDLDQDTSYTGGG